jgi:hypothetical protein
MRSARYLEEGPSQHNFVIDEDESRAHNNTSNPLESVYCVLWGRSKHGKVQQQFSWGVSNNNIIKKNLFSSLFYQGREDIFFDTFF